jgi:hypothetical protein
MKSDLIAGFLIGISFVSAAVFSLLMIFDPKIRRWFLKKTERQRWRIWPVKKSGAQQRREVGEGMILAGAVLITLIFLPIGLIILIVSIWQFSNALFK